MSADLHDALREQGLVPPHEDVHFVACSTDYRQKINAASDGLVDANDYERLEEKLAEAEDKIEALESEVTGLERKVEDLETDIADAEANTASFRKEAIELRAENTRLTEKLLATESVVE